MVSRIRDVIFALIFLAISEAIAVVVYGLLFTERGTAGGQLNE